jgi:succinate dehydrogenase hydrophobic membrane anchor protein
LGFGFLLRVIESVHFGHYYVIQCDTISGLAVAHNRCRINKDTSTKHAMHTNRDTFKHWLLQRLTAALFIPSWLLLETHTLLTQSSLSKSLLALCNGLTQLSLVGLHGVFWHLQLGLNEILADYVNHEVTRHLIAMLLRVLICLMMKYALVLFVLLSA